MPHAKVSDLQRSRAKKLRQTMTPAEILLWRHIKAHRIDGLGFRRQAAIGPYIADFVCHGAWLIIELDGASHEFSSQVAHDKRRDAWFASQGYMVLRYLNEDVFSNLAGVVEAIRAAAAGRSNLPPSLTLPHKGGGNRVVSPGEEE
ncbi:MAG TPA: DUF559 domain-containing protein [Xanthobacteraceae bacterium]|nr:DUF559 domain-containing protein [Xanthobacteraceae bacterium]